MFNAAKIFNRGAIRIRGKGVPGEFAQQAAERLQTFAKGFYGDSAKIAGVRFRVASQQDLRKISASGLALYRDADGRIQAATFKTIVDLGYVSYQQVQNFASKLWMASREALRKALV